MPRVFIRRLLDLKITQREVSIGGNDLDLVSYRYHAGLVRPKPHVIIDISRVDPDRPRAVILQHHRQAIKTFPKNCRWARRDVYRPKVSTATGSVPCCLRSRDLGRGLPRFAKIGGPPLRRGLGLSFRRLHDSVLQRPEPFRPVANKWQKLSPKGSELIGEVRRQTIWLQSHIFFGIPWRDGSALIPTSNCPALCQLVDELHR